MEIAKGKEFPAQNLVKSKNIIQNRDKTKTFSEEKRKT